MVLLTSQYNVLKDGDGAPDFNLKGIDGKSYSLASFKGKPILVIFMCNHCPYVKPKMEYLVKLQQKYGEDGLQLVAINPNDPTNYPEDSLEGMQKLARKKAFNFPYLIDETQEVAKSYGAVCTPDPFLFNSEHKLVYHGRFDDAHGQAHLAGSTTEMEDAIRQLLSEGKVTVTVFPSMGCSIKWKPPS